jgi:hypothetical protein
MKKYAFFMVAFIVWTVGCFLYGFLEGKNKAEKQVLIKTVTVYKEREKNTQEQEKTAEKIKIIYRELKTDDKDCDYVLDFDVSKCLPK